MIYNSFDPVFFQSISNRYMFRLSDGRILDGKPSGLSKMIYRSIMMRDYFGFPACDQSWLESGNSFFVGHLVNNTTDASRENGVLSFNVS